MTSPAAVWYTGGCHCGAVRFDVRLTGPLEVHDCNCSICAKTGFLHIIVAEKDFRLNQGAEGLTRYHFNTGTAEHLFCRSCGIKSFYRPRSNPDGWSVNARCLDWAPDMTVTAFDGRNWEQNGAALAHLSKETPA